MSGIFLSFYKNNNHTLNPAISLKKLKSRGKNSSSLLFCQDFNSINIIKSNRKIDLILPKIQKNAKLIVGYTGTDIDFSDNICPIAEENIILFFDGLVLDKNTNSGGSSYTSPNNAKLLISEIKKQTKAKLNLKESIEKSIANAAGIINALIIFPKEGYLFAVSNNGGLYSYEDSKKIIIASERSLCLEDSKLARKIIGIEEFKLFSSENEAYIKIDEIRYKSQQTHILNNQTNKLIYKWHNLRRCSRCVLPETMPYISFNINGVCNYCENYKKRNQPKDINILKALLEPYKRTEGYNCIIPFSGGRDSCFALHVAVKELNLKPITYTYDWGMVTDVGRRNISLMCKKLGVENIVIADDIQKKRKNIANNFSAWLKAPHLGMINILTAGDKHFFKYINKVKRDTKIDLNLWGINPLEVTHFKTGFLGIPPNFLKESVYSKGRLSQIRYQLKRLRQMTKSPSYFNTSLWDTWSGEYYRSSTKKTDYFEIFDYLQWSEKEIDSFLKDYEWQRASDTSTTWRIGDGTAGLYNYIYFTVAGFTEHDTFRSNQIREGEITRDEALILLESENAPCYDNIPWYLQSIGFDFSETISRINSIPRLHKDLY